MRSDLNHQPPRLVTLNQGSLNIVGDGWRVHIRIVHGWWRPRLQVSTYRYGESEWTC